MLKKIKASFFLKLLFFHISEGHKLKVARHSKYLQKILDRRLIHYKLFSERYLVLGQDGKGKEYMYYGELRFEGEYLNEERNGKGKEYDYFNGKLRFEGEYLNGKRNGKGKEYNKYGKLIFEGEYLNGKRNGKGKEYNKYGKLRFEGEYYEDRRISSISKNQKNNLTKFIKKDKYSNKSANGQIKEYDVYTGKLRFEGDKKINYNEDEELIFKGEYLLGKRNGKCKEYNDDELEFEGEYIKGKKSGKGKKYYDNGKLIYEVVYVKRIIIFRKKYNYLIFID